MPSWRDATPGIPPASTPPGGATDPAAQPNPTARWNPYSYDAFGTRRLKPPTPPTAPPPPPAGPTGPGKPGEGFGPGFGESYGSSHIGQYDTPSALETFAQQQMDGNNPYYARLRQQGMDAINQQMAARGHYNSGGALSALGNYSAAVDADQFANMGKLLGDASNLSLNRHQLGFDQAKTIEQLQLDRMQKEFDKASALAALGVSAYENFYRTAGDQSGDAAFGAVNAGADADKASGQADSSRVNSAFDILKAVYGAKSPGGGGGGNGLQNPTYF